MERVLVVRKNALFERLEAPFDAFHPGARAHVLDLIACESFFEDRARAEEDRTLKQVIPYGVVVHGDEVFVFRRSKKGGEARLHDMVSLGVGGHVNPEDAERGSSGALQNAFERELNEELDLGSPYSARVVGFVNDDSTPVGQVHFGVVYRIDVAGRGVRVKEEDALSGSFVPIPEIARYRDQMESWSRLVQDHFWGAGRS